MKHATLHLETLTCPSCTAKVQGALKGLKGVDPDSIKVLFNASKAKVTFNEDQVSIEEIQEALEKIGYPVKKVQVS